VFYDSVLVFVLCNFWFLSLIFLKGYLCGVITFFVNKTFEMGLTFFEMNAGILWGDWDNDGFLDLFQAQYSYDPIEKEIYRYSRIYFNSGPEKNYKLEDRTWELGCIIHGAWAPIRLDYDNDGDLDLIVASDKENLKLFRNDMDDNGNWIAIRLKGSPEDNISSEAFGSSVTVYAGGNMYYRALPGVVSNGRASQSSNILHFGIGDAVAVDSLVVKYSDGNSKNHSNLNINKYYTLEYMKSVGISYENAGSGDFYLNNCSPNPVEGSCIIEFSVADNSFVELTMSDLEGKIISKLVAEQLTPGIYKFNYDSGQLPAGTYYYQLKSGSFSDTKIMSVVR
jgi:hypothetical protein